MERDFSRQKGLVQKNGSLSMAICHLKGSFVEVTKRKSALNANNRVLKADYNRLLREHVNTLLKRLAKHPKLGRRPTY